MCKFAGSDRFGGGGLMKITVFKDVTSFAFTHVCQDNGIWGL